MKQQVYEEALKRIIQTIDEGRNQEPPPLEGTSYGRALARSGVLGAVKAIAQEALGK